MALYSQLYLTNMQYGLPFACSSPYYNVSLLFLFVNFALHIMQFLLANIDAGFTSETGAGGGGGTYTGWEGGRPEGPAPGSEAGGGLDTAGTIAVDEGGAVDNKQMYVSLVWCSHSQNDSTLTGNTQGCGSHLL